MKLFYVLLLLSASACAQDTHVDFDPFDKPLKTVVDLGPSPYYRPSQHMRKKLTCYVYSTFMVKEYDEGQKGAEWLSIFRFKPSDRHACSLSHFVGEKLIRWKEWSGYFKGVKGSFVFFDAPDGTDEGMPFAVYDARTGAKLFEDSASLRSATHVPSPSKVFDVSLDDKQQLVLKYLRVVSTNCDLNKDGAVCWKRVRAKYGISETKQPVCSRYEHDYFGKWSSAIGYPVSVVVSTQPRIKPVGGSIFCWPVD